MSHQNKKAPRHESTHHLKTPCDDCHGGRNRGVVICPPNVPEVLITEDDSVVVGAPYFFTTLNTAGTIPAVQAELVEKVRPKLSEKIYQKVEEKSSSLDSAIRTHDAVIESNSSDLDSSSEPEKVQKKKVEKKKVVEKKVEEKKVEEKKEEEKKEEDVYKFKYDDSNEVYIIKGKAVDAKAIECKAFETKTVDAKAVETKTVETKAVETKTVEEPLVVSKNEGTKVAEQSSSSSKGKKFLVSFGDKTGHPWGEYNKVGTSIYVNGKNGPVLHLYRGCTYFFVVDKEAAEHSFVLTTSPMGGKGSSIVPGGFAAVSKGSACFKITDDTPRYFFYQDANAGFKGGLVIVHDE